jgi:hypothetical protein
MISRMWVGIAAVVVSIGSLSACADGSSTTGASPSASPSAAATVDATAQATALTNEYLTSLRDGNSAGLEALLSPAFQVIRADGSTADKTAYLEAPPEIEEFTVSNVVATRDATALVARYDVTTTETVDGKQYAKDPAPRLSVFVDQGGDWQLIAHANLNLPEAAVPANATPAPVTNPAPAEVAEQVQDSLTAFYQALVDNDPAVLEALLAPAFQIVRADGSHADKEQYLADPAQMASFTLSDFATTAENEVAVARYMAATEETIDGQAYGRSPAPRMAVLVNDGDVWQIAALVNLNTPTD